MRRLSKSALDKSRGFLSRSLFRGRSSLGKSGITGSIDGAIIFQRVVAVTNDGAFLRPGRIQNGALPRVPFHFDDGERALWPGKPP